MRAGKVHFSAGIFTLQNRFRNFAKNVNGIFGAILSFLNLFFGEDNTEIQAIWIVKNYSTIYQEIVFSCEYPR